MKPDYTLSDHAWMARRVMRIFWVQLVVVAMCGLMVGYGLGKI
jgi:hypothetical protein